MTKHWPFWTGVAISTVALMASAMLLSDYMKPAPVFCAVDGACGRMRQTVFAYPLGIPLPLYGIAGLLAVSVLGLWPGRRARLARAALAAGGALVAVGLLIVQATLHTLCPYCAVVDIGMLTLAGVTSLVALRGWNPPDTIVSRALSLCSFAAAIGIPLAIGAFRQPAVPEVIARELAKAPGKVTIVDFVDFECPFCRATHADLSPLLEQRRGQVSVARKQVPLPMHGHALDAARAACCGEALGKADDIADALFAATPAELTPEGCERIAVTRGLPLERFRACVADPATDAKIRADIDSFRATQSRGLPTLWIGKRKLEGRQDQATLRAALDDAARSL
jgi:uncharacterized membrane protein/predicted DsbA family dithiol-disulfide isomerase